MGQCNSSFAWRCPRLSLPPRPPLSIPTFLSLALFGSARYNRSLSQLLGFQLSCLLYLSQIVLVSVCRGHSTRALSQVITGWDGMGNRSRSLSRNYCISSRREISFRMALVQCRVLSIVSQPVDMAQQLAIQSIISRGQFFTGG